MTTPESSTPGRRVSRSRIRKRTLSRRPSIPPVAVPSTFTLLNLLSGFYAIINVSHGNFAAAGWLIAAACLFDLFDGMLARLVNGTSAFGVELDSLADIVSFGVAPSFLLYEFGLKSLGMAGVVVASLPALCGAVRLARYNVSFVEKKDHYEGLPIPVQAMTVVAFILVFYNRPYFEVLGRGQLSVLVTLVVVLSLLMVSSIRFDAFPAPSARTIRQQPLKILAVVVGALLIIFFLQTGLLVGLALYLLHGIGRAFVWGFRAATDEEPPPDIPPNLA